MSEQHDDNGWVVCPLPTSAAICSARAAAKSWPHVHSFRLPAHHWLAAAHRHITPHPARRTLMSLVTTARKKVARVAGSHTQA